ncbi:MAG: aldo/keto reductase [Elusimicrobia bacterium]|nr:aldo/keto reductase [Elusimicrobiota bacterium]
METRKFGKTGKDVSVIGVGTYGHGDAYGGMKKEVSQGIIEMAIRQIPKEVNLLIDTAPRYGSGNVESWLGEVIKEKKAKNVLVASKIGRHIEEGRVNEKDFSSDFLRADLDNSLKRLGVEKVFLCQLHNPSLEIINDGLVFDLLEEFREEGKIEYYGVSIDKPEEGVAAIDVCQKKGYDGLASLQVIYNILIKKAEKELFPKVLENGIAIIAREPLLRGFLTWRTGSSLYISNHLSPACKKIVDMYGENQLRLKLKEAFEYQLKPGKNDFPRAEHDRLSIERIALKFVISHPAVSVVIPGMNDLWEVEIDFHFSDDWGKSECLYAEYLCREAKGLDDLVIL